MATITTTTTITTTPMANTTTSIPSPKIITCPDPPIDHLDRHGYLFGYPIAHSMSSLLHQTIFSSVGLQWGQQFLPSTDMSQFLRLIKDNRLYGSAVTMPHKVSILPYLTSLTPECEAVGACNTIFRRGDALIGANTDTVGIRDALLLNVPDPSALFPLTSSSTPTNPPPPSSPPSAFPPALVIGGGGAARSACYALVRLLGFSRVYLVNRDEEEVAAVMQWCTEHGYGDGLVHVQREEDVVEGERPSVVVACIPDVEPMEEREWRARRVVEAMLREPREGAVLLEMCYHPRLETEMVRMAEREGWRVVLGTEAMIYQGIKQHEYWHGREVSKEVVGRVRAVVAERVGGH